MKIAEECGRAFWYILITFLAMMFIVAMAADWHGELFRDSPYSPHRFRAEIDNLKVRVERLEAEKNNDRGK